MQNRREPIFNLPATIVAIAIVLTAIHIVRLLLTPQADIWVLYGFGFVPARFDPEFPYYAELPGGAGADVWTFVTYAFLHGNWMHLGVNLAWMVAFGTPVLRRFGRTRFLLLSAVSAIAGSALHLATHWGDAVPMIGASAAISGQMGAAVRFAFEPHVLFGSPLTNDSRWKKPALPLFAAFTDIRVVAFVVVWFGLNIAFGTTSIMPGMDAPVAWQAHIGGFLVGLLLFSYFDPHPAAVPADPAGADDQSSGSS